MNKQEKCILETKDHMEKVRLLTKRLALSIMERGECHDASKLVNPELPYFVKHTEKLSASTYGSDEYHETLSAIKPALDHHYATNRHHPEHYPDGIKGMNLVDIVELLCDWKASSTRHNDGNILKSIAINAKRFDMSDDLVAILQNTAELLEL